MIVVVVLVVMMVMMDCLVSREALHTSPSIMIPFTQYFFPETQTTSHSRAHTHKQCLIKAHILITNDSQDIERKLKKHRSITLGPN